MVIAEYADMYKTGTQYQKKGINISYINCLQTALQFQSSIYQLPRCH